MAGVDRLSDLPEPILIHILSMLPHAKQVVQTCILSKQWRFLWKSVPVSLDFEFSDSDNVKDTLDFMASTNRELNYWRYCNKIRKFRVCLFNYRNHYVKDVDLWIHFATKLANVESFAIEFQCVDDTYEFPQFAFKNASLRNLVLRHLELNPSGSVNWSSLVSLSIGHLNLTESVIEKVLSGCPNLERLKLYHFWGIYRLEISSTKLRKLIIKDYYNLYDDLWLEILAPFIQTLELLGQCSDVRVSRKTVPSLVTAVLHLDRLNFYFDEEDDEYDEVDPTLEKQYSNMKELLHSVAHVENLQLSSWCIECLSILELKGWQPPPSSRKFLKLNAALEQLDFPGICSFLQSSSYLKTLVIDWNDHKPRHLWSTYTNEDEHNRRFETHNFDRSLLHLKTIKIVNFDGPLYGNKSVMPFVKYLLKNATVLEKLIVAAKYKGSDEPQDYVKMVQEFQCFPRASPYSSVVFSY